MSNVKLNIFYPTDLLGNKVGGAETFLKGLIEFSPVNFDVNFFGISSTDTAKVGRWTKSVIGGKTVNCFSLFFEKDENSRAFIPLSLRYTIALKKVLTSIERGVLFFNRIEPCLLFSDIQMPKIGVIHNDISNQLNRKKSELLWSLFPSIYSIVEKRVFLDLDVIYTVSHASLAYYEARYSFIKERFSFSSTWVDSNLFHLRNSSKHEIRLKLIPAVNEKILNKRWILFVGRLQAQKGPLRLLESVARLLKASNSFSLIVVGSGNLRTRFVERARALGIDNNIFLTNALSREVLADFYNASDLLVLTSNFEGMPMCMLEALGCGTPVVSTDVGEVRRVVRDGYSGEVVKSLEPRDIAAAIKKILDNPQKYKSEYCIESVKAYTPQNVLAPIYDKIKELYWEKYESGT